MAAEIGKVTVYCASSRRADPFYYDVARRLGGLLAAEKITVVYGGGAVGAMGALADGALAHGGRVEGVLPRFMYDLEWGHPGLTDLHLVGDLHERKRLMLDEADAVVALPGGCGTFEELFEAMAWKRLGLYVKPIVIVNARGYYDPGLKLLEQSVRMGFMDEGHATMWSVVDEAEQVLDAIRNAPPWDSGARDFAVP